MTTLNRFEAAALLGISERTLRRRVESGKIECTRIGEGKFAEVSFTYAQLGLPEPAPVVIPEPAPAAIEAAPEPEPQPVFAPRPTDAVQVKQDEDYRFAQAYLAGEVTDSAGNNVNGTNERFPTKGHVSLLGPRESQRRERISSTDHMQAGLIGTNDSAGRPHQSTSILDTDEYRKICGHATHADIRKAAKMDAPLAEQEGKIFVDRATVLNAISKGFSR